MYTLIAAGALPHLRVGLGRGAIRVRAADAEAFERDRRRSDAADIAEHIGATNPCETRE